MRRRLFGGAAALLLVGAAALTLWQHEETMRYRASPSAATLQSPNADATERAVQLRVWGEALSADPRSALVLGHLAALHAQRAREEGNFSDYLEAEQLARRSLALRTQRNGSTASTLVSVLLAQHRFADAYEVAKALVAREPDVASYRASLAEVAMELGDYTVASATFDRLWRARGELSVAPRLARWLELRGQVREARRLLKQSRDIALARRELPHETRAWFCLRLGDLERRAGNPRAAAEAYRQGLEISPTDVRLRVAMSRLALERGLATDAVRWGELALASRAEPATLLALAAAYESVGDSARAAQTAEALRAMANGLSGPPHRDWLLWQLDHGEQLPAVLAVATREAQNRRDVYGLDVAAWAYYRNGRRDDARRLMAQALALGTQDPLLAEHAAQIFKASGESSNAAFKAATN
jgi:tetratricopeptide (TPR) repeat protein